MNTAAVEHQHHTIANNVITTAAMKIEQWNNRVQNSIEIMQPYLNDLDIHYQQHRFINAPLILQARGELITVDNMLNIARYRLNEVKALMAHEGAVNLAKIMNGIFGVHAMLYRVAAQNNEIMRLFQLVHDPDHATRRVFRDTSNLNQ